MKSLRNIFAFTLILSGLTAFAHEGTFGTLSGDKLQLFWSDHALSGHVGEQVVYAVPEKSEFKLFTRAHGKNFSTAMASTNGKLGGTISSEAEDGTAISTSVTVAIGGKNEIKGTVDTDSYSLKVSSKTMNGSHYVDPEFELTVGTNTYHFKMENGQACLGCIGKIAFVVVGMLRSTGQL